MSAFILTLKVCTDPCQECPLLHKRHVDLFVLLFVAFFALPVNKRNVFGKVGELRKKAMHDLMYLKCMASKDTCNKGMLLKRFWALAISALLCICTKSLENCRISTNKFLVDP
eukprot:scaffold231801_cov15-Tisochrysis_lutea.AAC.1